MEKVNVNMNRADIGPRKRLNGIVVSDKMHKTIVVKVDTYRKTGKYGKYVNKSSRYKAHDEKNVFKIGDKVTIVETKPISKDKRFIVLNK